MIFTKVVLECTADVLSFSSFNLVHLTWHLIAEEIIEHSYVCVWDMIDKLYLKNFLVPMVLQLKSENFTTKPLDSKSQ